MAEPFEIAQKVKSALLRNQPVVAIESSVIAQGLPGGKGVEAALAMSEQIEKGGCTPAVIGIIDGKVTIGLSEDEIKKLAEAENVMKVSTREVADAIVRKANGATTVAATLSLALSSGIPIMVTGGIGGVHRDASETFDISADLWQMAVSPGMVVCSGAKSVLDLPATLEWLETHQIGVYGYETDEFPAFFSPKSGLKVPCLDKADDVTETFKTRIGLGMRSAMILGVPVPKKNAIDADDAIEAAVKAAAEQGIKGQALTPWLLSKVQEATEGKAIETNIALLKNNATVAAKIATAIFSKEEKRIGFK